MSFRPFLRNLIENGTIPYQRYAISAENNGCGSGDVMTINSPDFMTKCFQTNLIDQEPTEGASARLTALNHKFVFVFTDGQWTIQRHWVCTTRHMNPLIPGVDLVKPKS